jgi:hypothetical protein
MKGFGTHLFQIAFCAGLFAVAQTVPGTGMPRSQDDASSPVDLSRLRQSSDISLALAQGRAPVPLTRDAKLMPFLSPGEFETNPRSVVTAIAPPPVTVARVDPARPVARRESDAKWAAVLRPRSTELAVTITP